MAFSMSSVIGIFLVSLVLASTAADAAGSHQTAPAPAVDCSSLVLNMADCLSFVTSGSTVKKPEGTCCDGLKHVLKTNADCLCQAFKNSAQLGVTLNVTKALSLPAACRVSAPSVSNCGLSTESPALSPVPGGALAPSPSDGSASSDALSPPPAHAPGTGGSSMVSASLGLMAVAVASLALF